MSAIPQIWTRHSNLDIKIQPDIDLNSEMTLK
jgi:hypothetical protein